MRRWNWVIALMFCLPSVSLGDARPRSVVVRPARRVRFVEAGQAVYAVPVATVVVAVQPTLLYSYRAAAQPSALVANEPSTVEGAPSAATAEAVLRNHCARCHSGVAPSGGASLFAEDGSLAPLLARRAILEMASPNAEGPAKMPPGEARKLDDAELELLRAWAEPPRDLKY